MLAVAGTPNPLRSLYLKLMYRGATHRRMCSVSRTKSCVEVGRLRYIGQRMDARLVEDVYQCQVCYEVLTEHEIRRG